MTDDRPTTFRFGCAVDCNMRVTIDPYVTPYHCEITVDGDGAWWVRSLDPQARTTVVESGRGYRLEVGEQPERFYPEDRIEIGAGWTVIQLKPWFRGGLVPDFNRNHDHPFTLNPPMGWMNRIDEMLIHHGAVDHHRSHLGEALANLIRSWWGEPAEVSGRSAPRPEYWGPREQDRVAS